MAGGEPVPVTFEGTAYFSGEAMPVESAGPPPEAEVTGMPPWWRRGLGCIRLRWRVLIVRYVTWVWDMKKDTQGDYSLLVAGDWHDGYGLALRRRLFATRSRWILQHLCGIPVGHVPRR